MSSPALRTPTAFQCPLCRERDNDVKDSRPSTDGFVRRRRYCNSCSTSFTTVEVPIDLWKDEALERDLSAAHSALTEVIKSFNTLRRIQRERRKSIKARTLQIKDLPHA